ncbi:hypothetical protein KS4_26650 [Poriferisphaera corsica]|uniref:Uncharacterized protein n=1 Tax=Poriferisphaera corsica TaxID=2528020 RepID=A0A517YWJ6_9BACT|nr:hypothetical protein [Poriferisphaera corsica]QDU34594.1 hypothetical protein KS4_26650 [Poriferisphaera corsica]
MIRRGQIVGMSIVLGLMAGGMSGCQVGNRVEVVKKETKPIEKVEHEVSRRTIGKGWNAQAIPEVLEGAEEVARGYNMVFRSSVGGVIYVVELNHAKIIKTEYLVPNHGSAFSMNEHTVDTLFGGGMFENCDFAMFFKPDDGVKLKSFLDDTEMVGGGVAIEYVAPGRGDVYLVDAGGERIVFTKSVDKGDVVDLMIDPDDEDMAVLFGNVPLSELKLELYFKAREMDEETHDVHGDDGDGHEHE